MQTGSIIIITYFKLRENQNKKVRPKNSITLPINPENIEVENPKDVKTYNVLGFGETALRGVKKLQRMTLNSFLPDKDNYFSLLASFIDKTDFKPYTTVSTSKKIDEWVKNNDVIRVIIADGLNEGVNKPFLIENFKKIIHENIADLDYELSLIEYDVPDMKEDEYITNTKTIENSITTKIQKLVSRANNKFIPQQMVVKAGQTIYKIARLYYGGKGSNELAKLNGIIDRNKDISGQIIEMLPLKNVL